MNEDEKASGDEHPEAKPKVLVKKRKKKVHLVCDRTCRICKTPCDNPFYPEQVKKDNK